MNAQFGFVILMLLPALHKWTHVCVCVSGCVNGWVGPHKLRRGADTGDELLL